MRHYEKDGKLLDVGALEEIKDDSHAHAQIIKQAFIGSEQFEGALQAQRTGCDVGIVCTMR